MNARTISPGNPQAALPRFDRQFIEDHKLLERYLENKLRSRALVISRIGAARIPNTSNELRLSERAQTSLKLLEASGQPQDLREPQQPWWKSIYVPIGLGVVAVLSLIAFWALFANTNYCAANSTTLAPS